MRTHLFVPDTQVRAGVPTDHIAALGRFIVDKKPDVIILAGDWYDMPATSRWNSPSEAEGLRIADDIQAGNDALAEMMRPVVMEQERLRRNKKKGWVPELHVTLGNHEYHLVRYVEQNPSLEGLIGYHLLDFEKWGFKVHDFLLPVEVDGILYCHFFVNPSSGKTYSGMIETRLKNIGQSFTQGHLQSFKYGELERPNGRVDHGLVAGAFYQHDEPYKGHQGNHHWRGVIMKHEVKDGQYDIMKVSLNYLLRKYRPDA
jgi:hypothetical protein